MFIAARFPRVSTQHIHPTMNSQLPDSSLKEAGACPFQCFSRSLAFRGSEDTHMVGCIAGCYKALADDMYFVTINIPQMKELAQWLS